MRVTEEIIQYYLPYFKKKEDLEEALLFEESAFDRKKKFAFIKCAVEIHSKFSIQYTQEATGVIYTNIYEIYFAVLPTGDVVYYTANKKTNRRGNYHRIVKLESVYNHLIKLGILEESVRLEEILYDALFGDKVIEPFSFKQQSNTKLIFEENDWSHISINSSMTVDKEFLVIDGSGEIILTTDADEEKVGYIGFKIFNSNLLNKSQLWEAADAASGDEEWLMSTLMEIFEEEIEEWSPKFLMLNTILIEPIYRNRGYGKAAIKELIQLCDVLEIDYIVLKPSPIEEVDFSNEYKMKRKHDIEKLVSFYDQIGFDSYLLGEDKEPIMVLDVNDLDLE